VKGRKLTFALSLTDHMTMGPVLQCLSTHVIESLHLSGHPMPAAVLRATIKGHSLHMTCSMTSTAHLILLTHFQRNKILRLCLLKINTVTRTSMRRDMKHDTVQPQGVQLKAEHTRRICKLTHTICVHKCVLYKLTYCTLQQVL
jgi:hypothetical protein